MEENCIFCKIIKGDIPSTKVYEDENLLGFLTIRPVTKGHMLLIPKKHSEDIIAMDKTDYDYLFSKAKNISEKIKSAFSSQKVGYLIAGLEVPHTHLHLMPINEIKDMYLDKAYDLSDTEREEVRNLYSNLN